MARSAINDRRMIVALGLVLGLVCAADAQTNEPGSPPREGITVHGHWIIDVRNPDGSLVSHHDFENELTPPATLNSSPGGGAGALAGVLGGAYSIRSWRVGLEGSPSPWGTSEAIILQTTSFVGPFPHIFRNLTVHVPTSTQPGIVYATGTFELEGSATALNAGAITLVRTQIENGLPGGLGVVDVTRRALSPIAVAAGQIVQVKVILSFS